MILFLKRYVTMCFKSWSCELEEYVIDPILLMINSFKLEMIILFN
jgi:hypothetical protein